MTQDEIIEAIRGVVRESGSVPGRQTFERVTGIKMHSWYGRYWANWGAALSAAGFAPNDKNGPADREFLLSSYLELVEDLGHVPTEGELRVHQRLRIGFPSHSTFRSGLGPKAQLLRALLEYAQGAGVPEATLSLITAAMPVQANGDADDASPSALAGPERDGYVYLMKSGKHFKIGRTNALDRRQYELGVQLPEPIEPIHSIRTDDPSGIEAYWHNRFRSKRLNGEWFRLSADDVRAFKRRTFM